jgi:hypothetical protein
VKIQLAPLRERQEDIPSLIDHFLARADANRSLTAEALEVMDELSMARECPGVGKLHPADGGAPSRPAIARGGLALAASKPSGAKEISVHDGGSPGNSCRRNACAGLGFAAFRIAETGGAASFVSDNPDRRIGAPRHPACLDYTGGDRAIAAHLLGIGRTTLYRKLKEYKVESAAAVSSTGSAASKI